MATKKKVAWFLWDETKTKCLNIRWIKQFQIYQSLKARTWVIAATDGRDWFTIKADFLVETAARDHLEKLLDGKVR